MRLHIPSFHLQIPCNYVRSFRSIVGDWALDYLTSHKNHVVSGFFTRLLTRGPSCVVYSDKYAEGELGLKAADCFPSCSAAEGRRRPAYASLPCSEKEKEKSCCPVCTRLVGMFLICSGCQLCRPVVGFVSVGGRLPAAAEGRVPAGRYAFLPVGLGTEPKCEEEERNFYKTTEGNVYKTTEGRR